MLYIAARVRPGFHTSFPLIRGCFPAPTQAGAGFFLRPRLVYSSGSGQICEPVSPFKLLCQSRVLLIHSVEGRLSAVQQFSVKPCRSLPSGRAARCDVRKSDRILAVQELGSICRSSLAGFRMRSMSPRRPCRWSRLPRLGCRRSASGKWLVSSIAVFSGCAQGYEGFCRLALGLHSEALSELCLASLKILHAEFARPVASLLCLKDLAWRVTRFGRFAHGRLLTCAERFWPF